MYVSYIYNSYMYVHVVCTVHTCTCNVSVRSRVQFVHTHMLTHTPSPSNHFLHNVHVYLHTLLCRIQMVAVFVDGVSRLEVKKKADGLKVWEYRVWRYGSIGSGGMGV